jgi:hypothetical protein
MQKLQTRPQGQKEEPMSECCIQDQTCDKARERRAKKRARETAAKLADFKSKTRTFHFLPFHARQSTQGLSAVHVSINAGVGDRGIANLQHAKKLEQRLQNLHDTLRHLRGGYHCPSRETSSPKVPYVQR